MSRMSSTFQFVVQFVQFPLESKQHVPSRHTAAMCTSKTYADAKLRHDVGLYGAASPLRQLLFMKYIGFTGLDIYSVV